VPGPQAALQAVQPPHWPGTHGTGQQPLLHPCVSLGSALHEPPHVGAEMLRVRVAVPGPQAASQFHADHSPTTQFRGQQPMSQLSCCHCSGEQSAPPHDAALTGERERERTPTPQATEQPLHSLHAPSTQLTAQQLPGQ
jgi:hypothetical protein